MKGWSHSLHLYVTKSCDLQYASKCLTKKMLQIEKLGCTPHQDNERENDGVKCVYSSSPDTCSTSLIPIT